MRHPSLLLPAAAASALVLLHISCGTQRKLKQIEQENISTTLALPEQQQQYQAPDISSQTKSKDTIRVTTSDGKELFLMKTIVDESGEAVANQVLDAAVVTARFRHLAERGGKVTIEFQIVVPDKLRDSKWQLRYQPMMFVLEDSTGLDKVLITGKDYRRQQMRGYEQYERWLNRIVTDSTAFIRLDLLEIFIARNLPDVYKYKNDTSFVSTEEFEGFFGVTEQEAIEHYTDHMAIERNEKRKAKKDKMYSKYVKAPYITEGLRLDTVMLTESGNYVYTYVQQLDMTGPQMRKVKKVDVVLDGEIYEQDKMVFNVPRTEPLTFYISSLSAFVDGTPHYVTRVVERRAAASANYNIDFPVGRSEVSETFGDNAAELRSIKRQLALLLDNRQYDLDSVVVTASSSPEGPLAANRALSRSRGDAISRYFDAWMHRQLDSLRAEDGFTVNVDETYEGTQTVPERKTVRFRTHCVPENWAGLDLLVDTDSVMSVTQKDDYHALRDIRDEDARERRMRGEPWYARMRAEMYPSLRTVQFRFELHRKGMIKDTLHTTELDSVYMAGVQAIRDRDYERAVALLTPYEDYNLAVACCALGRNHSALTILEKCSRTAQVNYMLAIIHSRFGDDEKAVQHYLDACNQNPQYVHRGNLDPEISSLIQKYSLNRQEE